MKKYYLFTVLVVMLFLSLWGDSSALSQTPTPDLIELTNPTTCPERGCAAGQRLNFKLNIAVTPKFTTTANTLVCVTTPRDGQSGAGILPWVDYSTGSLSTVGLTSGLPYTLGDLNNICTSNIQIDEALLASAYSTLPNAITDKLDLVLRINRTTDVDGYVRAYLFEINEAGTTWSLTRFFTKTITVTPANTPAYVAETGAMCGSFAPCYVNSADDLASGVGTGLKDAIDAFDSSTQINILSTYKIKSHTVLLNKSHLLQGYSNSTLSYSGDSCSMPMLMVTTGATIYRLDLNDGDCSAINRSLVVIDSSLPVTIESSTFRNGDDAILINDNSGNIMIRFNQITQNSGFAIKRASGTGTGLITAVANNIYDNKIGVQVDCQNRGIVDHNYWGSGVLPTSANANCIITPGKHLGAAILNANPGVQAERASVTSTRFSVFNNAVSFKRTSGSNFDIYIVNHGQGSLANIPFLNYGAEAITACSNFFDIFLAQGSAPTDLTLSFKYNLNSACQSTIESSNYCGQSDSALYPLWWYDPINNITDGWDRSGESPKGTKAAGISGQLTRCDLVNKEINLTLDSTGRPNLINDLNFTPFIVGVPLPNGIALSSFTADFLTNRVDIKWMTTSENDAAGFYILRSDSLSGDYNRITERISAVGNPYEGGIYNYTNLTIAFTKTYYYKLEVVNQNGVSIETYGPIAILTSTATPAATLTPTLSLTITPTSSQTVTPYIYSSPTAYFYSATPINKSPTPPLTLTAQATATSPQTLPSESTPSSGDGQYSHLGEKRVLDKTSRYIIPAWSALIVGSILGLSVLTLLGWILYKLKIL